MTESRRDIDPDWIDSDDAPELDDHFFEHAEVRKNGKLVRAATATMAKRGRPAMDVKARRQAVSLRLSPRVLDYFRNQGAGWQTMIGDVLEKHIDSTDAAIK